MIENASHRLVLVLVVVAAAGIALAGCRDRKQAPSGDVPLQGIVEYDERLVAFEVSGRIERVLVRRGDVVKKADLITEVDAKLEQLARDGRADDVDAFRADLALLESGARKEDVAALAAQLRAADATEGLLQKSLDRARQLRASQAISAAELDRSEAELARATNERASLAEKLGALRRGARTEEIARARSRLEAAQAQLALADARLERFKLQAGVDGVVLDVHVDPGELAAPGVPVASIADVGHPYVDVFVPQARLAGIVVSTKASVRVDGAAAVAHGVVEHVSPKTEFTPRYIFSERERPNLVVRVRVRVEDPTRALHAGVPAEVRFEP